jgi:hypothetical protein
MLLNPPQVNLISLKEKTAMLQPHTHDEILPGQHRSNIDQLDGSRDYVPARSFAGDPVKFDHRSTAGLPHQIKGTRGQDLIL